MFRLATAQIVNKPRRETADRALLCLDDKHEEARNAESSCIRSRRSNRLLGDGDAGRQQGCGANPLSAPRRKLHGKPPDNAKVIEGDVLDCKALDSAANRQDCCHDARNALQGFVTAS